MNAAPAPGELSPHFGPLFVIYRPADYTPLARQSTLVALAPIDCYTQSGTAQVALRPFR
jgi:hypothetical protein